MQKLVPLHGYSNISLSRKSEILCYRARFKEKKLDLPGGQLHSETSRLIRNTLVSNADRCTSNCSWTSLFSLWIRTSGVSWSWQRVSKLAILDSKPSSLYISRPDTAKLVIQRAHIAQLSVAPSVRQESLRNFLGIDVSREPFLGDDQSVAVSDSMLYTGSTHALASIRAHATR